MKIVMARVGPVVYEELGDMASVYQTRLSTMANVESLQLPARKVADKRSAKIERPAIELSSFDYLVALDERGKQWTSEKFAKRLETWRADPAIKRLVFLVGPPYGLDQATRASASELLSVSSFTMPSDLAWLVLWEQMYRAHTILKGMPYHHD
jgi:23S rRNA (pseudouridine1915-N3)-methyltransferase